MRFKELFKEDISGLLKEEKISNISIGLPYLGKTNRDTLVVSISSGDRSPGKWEFKLSPKILEKYNNMDERTKNSIINELESVVSKIYKIAENEISGNVKNIIKKHFLI